MRLIILIKLCRELAKYVGSYTNFYRYLLDFTKNIFHRISPFKKASIFIYINYNNKLNKLATKIMLCPTLYFPSTVSGMKF